MNEKRMVRICMGLALGTPRDSQEWQTPYFLKAGCPLEPCHCGVQHGTPIVTAAAEGNYFINHIINPIIDIT